MHLEIAVEELHYVANLIKVFKARYKSKNTAICMAFKDDCTELAYSSENFFIRFRHPYIAEFKGKYNVDLDFIRNILALYKDGIVELDFQDRMVTAHQEGTLLKGSVMINSGYNSFVVKEEELEEIPIEFTLSKKLLTLDLEELGFEKKDPYSHLYNVSKDKLIKMSSFCALFQTLEKPAQQDVTLTQDILSICALVRDGAQFFKYGNSFYIKDEELDIRMPLANIKFPSLDAIVNKVANGCEKFLVKTADWLDVCEKCCNLNVENKVNRVDFVFKDNLIMYSYNTILTGSMESGLSMNYKMSFNPLLMRGVLKYINEECVTICKNKNTNTILIHNEDKTVTFMLALCR